MKLCSICDRKIEGSWCKNCHRFVKTYDLPEGIHLNESHNPANDKDCTYHTTAKQQNASYGGSTTTSRPTYTRTTTGTQATSSTRNTATGGKKKGKIVLIIVILYFVISFIAGFIPVITNCVGAISDEVKKNFREEYEVVDPFENMPEQIEPDSDILEELAEYAEKIAAVEKLEPLDEEAQDDYVRRYYDPRDIVQLGFACDESHFDVIVPEFEEWLKDAWVDDYEVEDDISEYYNYFYEDDVTTWLSFSLYRNYYANDDLAVRVDYDTATQQLHMFGFVATMDVDASALYIAALREFDPETEWTQRFLKQKISAVLEEEGEQYVTIYTSDVLNVDVQVREGYYSVTFYPAYEY